MNKCDICHSKDDFLICANCLNKILKNCKVYKENVSKEKSNLQNVILEIFNKHNDKLMIYKTISLKNLKINKLEKKILNVELRLINKEKQIAFLKNMIFSKSDEYKNCNMENRIIQNSDCMQFNSCIIRNKYVKKLASIIFDKNILKMYNYMEIQTYIKPNMSQSVYTDFENIPNVLSTSTLFNNDILKINYDNNIQLRIDVINSRSNLLKLNQFIYKIMLFITFISSKLSIEFPFTISIQKYTIYNKLNNIEYKIYINENIKDNNFQDLVTGYTYLDYNLIHLKSFLNIKHNKNKDLKEFLNIESIIGVNEEYTEINTTNDNNILPFVIIDNYYN